MSDSAWLDLLQWLEEKGFDRTTMKVELQDSPAGGGRNLVALSDILPQQLLIRLPASSLLNAKTIMPLYGHLPQDKLSAIQLLCLHLARYRFGRADINPSGETFLPYIATLPKDFSTVPLWREVIKDSTWAKMWAEDGLLPYGLRTAVEDVSKRFWKDWNHTNSVLADELTEKGGLGPVEVEDFAWAWLCVNSRCIYYDLELPAREDNITLAPIIDMVSLIRADSQYSALSLFPPREITSLASQCAFSYLHLHSHNLISLTPQTKIIDEEDTFSLFSSGLDFRINDFCTKKILFKKGEEVNYSYSALSEYSLLAEYGFVLGMPANKDGCLDVTDRVLQLFELLPNVEKVLKQEILEANNYWGEYHFIIFQDEVDISYRLTMALALYHHQGSSSPAHQHEIPLAKSRKRSKLDANTAQRPTEALKAEEDLDFSEFYKLVNGEIDEISEENARKSKETLRTLCQAVQADSERNLKALEAYSKLDDPLVGMVRTVWEGEQWIASEYVKQVVHLHL